MEELEEEVEQMELDNLRREKIEDAQLVMQERWTILKQD